MFVEMLWVYKIKITPKKIILKKCFFLGPAISASFSQELLPYHGIFWQKLLDRRWAEKAVEEGLERGFYGCFKHILEEVPGKSIFPGSPRERMEAGEASQSCNIPIPELCVLQRGPGLYEKCPERGEPQTEYSEQGAIPENTGLRCQGTGWKEEPVPSQPLENRELFCSVFFSFFPPFSLWLLPLLRAAK